MIRTIESRISAHHNYLVNGILTPGFVSGDPDGADGFFFLADIVLPGESSPRISTRLFAPSGAFLLEIRLNRLGRNAGGFMATYRQGLFAVHASDGSPLLEVRTEPLANGYVTRLSALLHDETGRIRIAPHGDTIHVPGIRLLSGGCTG